MGVDYTGHFYYRDDSGLCHKLFICLFICTVTRAVHLEVDNNLTAASFILCLHRPAATHVVPRLLSDNHKTFIANEKFLQELQQEAEVVNYLNTHRIQWKTQTPRSPSMGVILRDSSRQLKLALQWHCHISCLCWRSLQLSLKELKRSLAIDCLPISLQRVTHNSTGQELRRSSALQCSHLLHNHIKHRYMSTSVSLKLNSPWWLHHAQSSQFMRCIFS